MIYIFIYDTTVYFIVPTTLTNSTNVADLKLSNISALFTSSFLQWQLLRSDIYLAASE